MDLYVLKEKSRNMKLKFKSASPDLYFTSIMRNLDLLLNEQKAQRIDLATLLRISNQMKNGMNLQKQVDEYFEQDETSPQTDSDNKEE